MTTASPAQGSDRIEDEIRLHAPRARVWRALTTPDELGAWFGADLAGVSLTPGARILRQMTIPGYEHFVFDVIVDAVDPQDRFAWRWHPNAGDGTIDPTEPRTLVTFTLEDTPDGGTLLRVVESGFNGVAASRRAAAFLGNTKGWSSQLHKRLVAYLATA